MLYAETKILLMDMFKIFQRMRAYRIYVTHMLTIRTAYAGYARHTLDTYEYATHTLAKACSREAGLRVVRIRSLSEILHTLSKICIRNAYAIVGLHL